jgi:hypothetical protein
VGTFTKLSKGRERIKGMWGVTQRSGAGDGVGVPPPAPSLPGPNPPGQGNSAPPGLAKNKPQQGRGRDLSPGGGAPPPEPQWAIATAIAPTQSISTTWQMGWEFTVGPADLTVTRFRCFTGTAAARTMRLWQISGAVLLVTEVITPSVPGAAWYESADFAPVVLTSGANYLVTTHAGGANMFIHYVPSAASLSYNGVSFVRSRGGDGTAMPGNSYTDLYGIGDILFT